MPQALGREVLELLLELHLHVVGHFIVVVVLEEVVLGGFAVVAPALAGLPCLQLMLLPGTVIGMLGR